MKVFSKSLKGMRMNAKLILGSLLCIAILAMSLAASPAGASSHNKRQLKANSDEGQQPSYTRTQVTIQKKSLKHVFSIGGKFAVNAETLIVDADGKEIKLKKMLVPCDAELFYLIENGKRTAKRINVKRTASDAHSRWTAEQPE